MIPDLNALATLDWRQPLWLLLALQPLLLWMILGWLQNRRQQQFAEAHLLPWLQVQQNKSFWQKIFSRNTAYFLAWVLFALALAGPRLPDKSASQQNEIVLDVMLVVDLSRSMLATDIKPSRLRRATLEAYEFLQMAKNARVGITVYAARPHLFVPLTSDFNALRFYLKNMDTLQLPTLGSDASTALAFAQKELLATKAGHKQVILWFSDGDFEAKNIAKIEAQITKNSTNQINTYILGLGTPEGAAIPLPDGSWLESEGQGILSKMDAVQLQRFSVLGKGRYATANDDISDWKTLYQKGMLATLKQPKHNNTQQWRELFPWVLFPAILLLIAALFPYRLIKPSPSIVASVFTLFFIFSLIPAYAKNAKNADDAAEESYDSALLQGINAYKNANYGKSKSQFIASVLHAKTAQERGIALHNLGNALFQTGDFGGAAEVFTDALRYLPKQTQTQKNQELTIALYTLLEKRRKRRFNRGNFAAPDDKAPLFDLPDQIPFMLSTKAVNLLKASLPELPKQALDQLLDKSIQQFKLLEGDKTQSAKQQKEQQDIEQARIHFMGLEEKTSNALWKRLFEIEEGFPGKLKKPKAIPGVRPW